jgi:TolB-like protein
MQRQHGKLRYLFENYCLDTSRRELSRAGDLVRLEPQVFDLLEFLIRNRERLASRDDLMASVWGGRIVSESAVTTRINAARNAIGDSGGQQRLIKTVPRKGIRFVGVVREEAWPAELIARQGHEGLPAPYSFLQDKPSIAVLPFANLSGDPEQDYFADGIVEDLITALRRIGWLFVIARNSSFTYKGRAVDVRQVGRELGVRYVLEGSFRKVANRVRITTQLLDASSGAHLSADRFDGMLDDIFDLQDQVTMAVVGAVSPKLEKAEITRAKHKPTKSLDAYDHYLRGLAEIYRWTRESHGEALRLFNKAGEIDPEFATAYGLAARCYNWRATNGWMTDKSREVAEATRLARLAIELGKDDAVALCMAGHAIARMAGDLETGARLIERALDLNLNLAAAWLSGGWVRVWLGQADEAIRHFSQAMRLSPIDPHMFNMQAGIASGHFIAGQYEEARIWGERATKGQPIFGPALRVAAASYAFTGRSKEAGHVVKALLDADPEARVSNLEDRVPWGPDGLGRLVEGLRMAGLPE